MITVQPSTTFEAVAQFASGLTGTVGVRIRDNQGNDSLARTTTGISADTTVGSRSVYRKGDFTAPATAGQYTIVWDDGTNIVTDDLLVTASAISALTGNLYVTRDEVKDAVSLTGQTYADDDIDRACNSASRAIDLATNRFFYNISDVRYYSPEPFASIIETDDIVTLTTLEVDLSDTGTFTTWTEDTDFRLDPLNSAANNKPYERVRLRKSHQAVWPTFFGSVRITGTFGWDEIPSEVNQYAIFLAIKLLYRTRHAPFGIIQVTGDIGAVARLARTDPDFDTLIGSLVKTRPFA